jgi:hypothetical protein
MPQKRISERRKDWADLAADLEMPDDGLTLTSFAHRIGVEALEAERAVRYLHRLGIVWMSKQQGHVRVYPIGKKPLGGRPPAVNLAHIVTMKPELFEFLEDVHRVFIRMALLDQEAPKDEWRFEDAGRRLEIADAIEVEVMNLLTMVRKFMADNRSITGNEIRKALWTVYPVMMPIVVKVQPALSIGDGPIPEEVEDAKLERIPRGMSDKNRMLEYIKRGGRKGETASKLMVRIGNISRWRIDAMAESLKEDGLITSAVCRIGKPGATGVRFFAAEYGQPEIDKDNVLVIR